MADRKKSKYTFTFVKPELDTDVLGIKFHDGQFDGVVVTLPKDFAGDLVDNPDGTGDLPISYRVEPESLANSEILQNIVAEIMIQIFADAAAADLKDEMDNADQLDNLDCM